MDNNVKIFHDLSVKMADLHQQIVESSGKPFTDNQAFVILHHLRDMHEKLSLSLSVLADLYEEGESSKH